MLLREVSAPGFDGNVAALKGAIEHHVEEKENVEANRMMNEGTPRQTIELNAGAPRVQP